jgi:hypothetical protein
MAFIGYRNQDLRNLCGTARQGGQQEKLLLQRAKTAALIFSISFFILYFWSQSFLSGSTTLFNIPYPVQMYRPPRK